MSTADQEHAMPASPPARQPELNESGELEAARAEVRATLAAVRKRGATARADSKLLRVRTRMAQQTYDEADLEVAKPVSGRNGAA